MKFKYPMLTNIEYSKESSSSRFAQEFSLASNILGLMGLGRLRDHIPTLFSLINRMTSSAWLHFSLREEATNANRDVETGEVSSAKGMLDRVGN